MHPNDDEDVLEVRSDGPGSEGVSPGLLEHDGHDVVPDVAFPQQLADDKRVLNEVRVKQTLTFLFGLRW